MFYLIFKNIIFVIPFAPAHSLLFVVIFVVLLFFLFDDTFQQLPMSPSEQVITHVDGLSSSFTIFCGFTYGVPIWLINGNVYDLYKVSFPFIELDGIYEIRISSITFCMNGTTFQCLSSQYSIPRGRLTRLEVIKSEFYCNCHTTRVYSRNVTMN